MPRLYYCSCCKGVVDKLTFASHEAHRELQRIEANVSKLTLLDTEELPIFPPVLETGPSAQVKHIVSPPSSNTPNPNPPTPTPTTALPPQSHGVDDDPQEAASWDLCRELDTIWRESLRKCEYLTQILDLWALGKPPPATSPEAPVQTRKQLVSHVQDELVSLKERVRNVRRSVPSLDAGNQIFASGIISDLESRVGKIQSTVTAVHSGISRPPNVPAYDTSRYFKNPLQSFSPGAIVILVAVVLLNVLAHVARGPCSMMLQLSRLALQEETRTDDDAYRDIPDDIRTARKAFNLDPVLTVFAVCSCGKLHPPSTTTPFPIYPATCPCGEKLTEVSGQANGMSIRKPIRTYAMQSFEDFCARLYSRPGIESLIRRQNRLSSGSAQAGSISDISEARAYQSLPGPDGRPFIDSTTEIRTIWSISYDSYNPLLNKAAGKAASVGSLAMACLSLPSCLRYRPENLYLVGLIPGPKQPSAEGLNPFLSPLMDTLHSSYHTGTFFERTYEHPDGILARAAVGPSVNDLPGGRKLVGGAGHSATVFCMYCHLSLPDINNIDTSTPAWRPKTQPEFRRAAQEWKDASSKSERERLYKENGVRWSELLRLDYWDPVQNVVIDGMHNLFLGLVRHHFREVIGTRWDDKISGEAPREKRPSTKDLDRCRGLLDRGQATLGKLEGFSIPVLRQICLERSIRPEETPGRRRLKRPFAIALLPRPSEPSTARYHDLEEGELNSICIEMGEGPTQPQRQPMLDTLDLRTIQDDIRKTLRPWGQPSPPKNFGSPSHGKLKADQWRACIEFDLPVSLVALWAGGDKTMEPTQSLALRSTFLLAMAIRYATSHRTSAFHREKYIFYISQYLWSILELNPDDELHPNHHNALHIPDFLERFGPIHGWWMFPFERLIGMLQKEKMNFKFGELEETVIRTFCSTSHLRCLLERTSPNNIFRRVIDIVRKCIPESLKGSMLTPGGTGELPGSNPTMATLAQEIVAVFPLNGGPSARVKVLQRIRCDFRSFACWDTSRAQSIVFFPSEEGLVPGVIRQIFEHNENVYLVVHPHRVKLRSYFDRVPDFGAEVWSRDFLPSPRVVPLSPSVHGAYYREWGANAVVLKPVIHDL